MRRALYVVLALAIAPTSAAAQTRGPSSGWREIFDPERRLGLMYRQQGLVRLIAALRDGDPELGDSAPHVLLDQALIRFERARRRMPDDPELAYYTAVALSHFERPAPDGSTERRSEEAMDAWRHVRQLDPSFQPGRVAFELAALHMRRHEFAEARAEYEAALEHAVPPTVELMDRLYLAAGTERQLAILFTPIEPRSVLGNLAEAAMLVGDVPAALRCYRAALDQSDDAVTRALALWGLAVASDRSGAHDDALRFAHRALQEDPVQGAPRYADVSRRHGAFALLHMDWVFFEPGYELHAYEALGHEALGRQPDTRTSEELRLALRSWRLFLAEGGNASRYAPVARAHVARLEAEIERPAPSPPARRRAPAPRAPTPPTAEPRDAS